MPKAKVYLDTTVPSAYFDARALERQELTREFWAERLPNFEVMISGVVLDEIRATPDVVTREGMETLVRGFIVLRLSPEADELAQEYLQRGIFPEKYATDASHVAIAVTNRVHYLISWNYRHLVKVNTRREVNLVNALKGYEPIEIITPPEL